MGDETRLPKWAQIELGRLRRDLARLRRDLAHAHERLSAGEASLVTADPFSDAPRHLGDRTMVEFKLPGGNVRIRIEDDALMVNGDNSITVHPRVSNAVAIQVMSR